MLSKSVTILINQIKADIDAGYLSKEDLIEIIKFILTQV